MLYYIYDIYIYNMIYIYIWYIYMIYIYMIYIYDIYIYMIYIYDIYIYGYIITYVGGDQNPFWDFAFVRYIELKLYPAAGLREVWSGFVAVNSAAAAVDWKPCSAETSLTSLPFQVQPNWSTSWQGPRHRLQESFKVADVFLFFCLYLYKTL